ncbi:TMhelix containing protein [Vibrio phage 1.178.O._10N.286.45.E12]|nr:TMhelix containing protein [Vibrio phage 1.178.O._10N.286.45.E12]
MLTLDLKRLDGAIKKEIKMKKPVLSKKIVAAVVALLAAIAGSFGLFLGDSTQDTIVDAACGVAIECVE